MTTRQLARSLALVCIAVLLVAGILARVVGQQAAPRPADGGRALSAPPAAAPTSPMVGVNPASFRYVTTYPAQDLRGVNLSKTINLAAHRYRLSPVGLLSVILSECSGYTQAPRCDRYGNWPDWSHGACQVSDATAGQFGVGNGTEAADAYVKAFEDNPVKCIWLAARVLRNFKNASGDSFPLLAADWNCGSSRYLYTETQCYQNHQAFLAWWYLSSRFGTNTKPKTTRVEPRTVGFDALDSPAVQRRLWRIPATYVVESSTYGEAGLTGGFAPLRDTDAIVPAWTHQRVYLPGHSWDEYQFDGCIFIEGSGIAGLFLTPTHQYFALLHMATCPLGGVSSPPLVRAHVPASAKQDDVTGLAFDALMRSGLARTSGVRHVHGGTFVGYSGWPSSYEYSNGSCSSEATCGVDAHECEVMTSGASDWFLWLAAGHDLPKPKPEFPIKAWRARTSRISPYDGHHHLLRIATFWQRHAKRLGGILSRHNVPKSRHNRHAYIVWRFVHGRVVSWPGEPKWKLRITH